MNVWKDRCGPLKDRVWLGCRLGSYVWRMGEDLGKDFPLSTCGLYAQESLM